MTTKHLLTSTELRARMADVRPIEVPTAADVRRTIRIRGGVTIETAAQAMSISPITLYRWEVEGRKPWSAHAATYGRLLAVCRALAAPMDAALRRVA